jgi:hypothetical protein
VDTNLNADTIARLPSTPAFGVNSFHQVISRCDCRVERRGIEPRLSHDATLLKAIAWLRLRFPALVLLVVALALRSMWNFGSGTECPTTKVSPARGCLPWLYVRVALMVGEHCVPLPKFHDGTLLKDIGFAFDIDLWW